MKSKIYPKLLFAIDSLVKVLFGGFLVLFTACVLIKSKLVLTPVTLISFVLILSVVLISKYKTERYKLWFIFMFVIAFLLRCAFIKIWPITPRSDCEMGYRLCEILSNTPIKNWHEVFAATPYYYDVWPMHIPFILY